VFQTALHTGVGNQQQQLLEPRMAQLETLEAKVSGNSSESLEFSGKRQLGNS